jgi:hypothetical protein
VSGSTTVSGAMVNLSTATLTNLGATLNISAGSLNLGINNANVSTFNLTGGEILGSGNLTIGSLTWSDGSMRGSGITSVNTALTLNGATPTILDQRTLVNHGTANWNNTSYLLLTNDAVIRNATGATMNMNTSVSFIVYGSGTFVNAGTLNFSLGQINVLSFQQAAGAALNLTIMGLAPGSDYGQISTQSANLDGTLKIDFSGFTPVIGNRFVLMDYATSPITPFATTQIIDHLPPNKLNWQLTYKANSLDLWTRSGVFLPVVVK